MNQDKKRRRSRPGDDGQLLDDVFQSSSATDCTGLIPSVPHSRAEQENYNELYTFLPEAAPCDQQDPTEDLPCANGGEAKKSK